MQNGSLEGGIRFLKKRWGQEWVKQKTNSQIICTPSALKRDTYDAKRKAGIDAILTFDNIMNIPQFPIIINTPYKIEIAKGLTLTGIYEYVREIEREDGTRIIQIMKFRSENNRFQIESQMNHNLELTAAAMAFNEMFNADKFELVYVDIYKKKAITSFRTQKDYDLLKDTVKGVALCLKHNIRCISPDKRCYHCEYRNICKVSME